MIFELSAKQVKKLEEWKASLPKKYSGAIGGAYTFEFTPNALGVCIVVKRGKKEKIELTDYDEW